MKKIYTIALSLFIGSLVAQSSFEVFKLGTSDKVAPNSIIKGSTTADKQTTIQFDIRNTSNASHSYSVKRYDKLLNHSTMDTTIASAFFCFGGNCFPTNVYDATEVVDALTIKPGETASETGLAIDPTNHYYHLDTDIIEASTVGISEVRYTFYNVSNKADSIQFAIRYNDPYVGIKETVKNTSRVELYPNPGTDFTTITLESSNDQAGQLKVFSSIGSVVYEKQILSLEGKHSFDLNLQNLSAGVYFVQLKEGSTSTTKKLVVQK